MFNDQGSMVNDQFQDKYSIFNNQCSILNKENCKQSMFNFHDEYLMIREQCSMFNERKFSTINAQFSRKTNIQN